MTTWQFHCPQCAGLFQIDSSFAGQTVGCPLCGVPIALPQQGPAPQGPPLTSGAPVQLACPRCSGGFLIGPEMAGQTVGCPHCQLPITVPPLQPQPQPPPQTMAMQPQPARPATTPHPPASTQQMMYPPGMERSAPSITAPARAANSPPPSFMYPPGMETPAAPRAEAPSKPGPAQASTAPKPAADNRYPPGMQPTKPQPERPAAARLEPSSLYPPGAKPKADDRLPPTPASRPSPAPAPAPAPKPAPISKPAPSAVDDLLPPGAGDIASLLPPGEAHVPSTPLTPPANTPIRVKPASDSLLPPGTEAATTTTAPMQQVALPKKEMAAALRPKLSERSPDGGILLPTEDGKVVELREPVKTIGHGRNERELHVLAPKVKQKRRLIRNLVVFTIGLALLVAVFVMLANWQ